MVLMSPELHGASKVIAKKFGKSFVLQQYRDPQNGEIIEYSLFSFVTIPTIVFPVTAKDEVIAIRQFRYGAGEMLIEVPGGNPKGDETPDEVARKELEDETGYRPGKLVSLGEKFWFEPASYTTYYYAFLAQDCTKVGTSKLDLEERLEVLTIPFIEWLAMIRRGEVTDDKTLALTLLAIPHLGAEIKIA